MSDDSLESDDECGFLRKALDVDLPEDFNPNSVPQNGLEYLHHVIYERNNCEKLVKSNIDPNKFRNNQTFRVPLKYSVQHTSERFIPSNEWQINKLEDFKYFKEFVNRQNTRESSISTFNEDDFMTKMCNETPIFSEFVKYSQSAKIRMLQLISKYLRSLVQGESIEDNVGTWIFAILVMLDIPLSPSFCHVIREFTKICLDLRSKLADDADERLFGPLNFNICICSKYFRQLDLSD